MFHIITLIMCGIGLISNAHAWTDRYTLRAACITWGVICLTVGILSLVGRML